MKKIYLFVFLTFFNLLNVYAATTSTSDFTYANVEEINSSSSSSSSVNVGCDGSTDNSITTNNNGVSTVEIVREHISTVNLPFNVVIMVDKTASMNVDTKIKDTNEAIENIISAFKEKNRNSKITLFKFSTYLGSKKEIDLASFPSGYNKNYLTESTTGGHTNIQLAYKQAYNYLNSASSDIKSKYVPMIVLITDGYPTISYAETDITGNLGNSQRNWGAISAYRTARSLVSLAESLKSNKLGYANYRHSKIVTVGVGMNSSDEYAKFILNPNTETFRALGGNMDNLYSSESYTLYQYISGATRSANLYDAVLTKNDGGKSSFGLFRMSKKKNNCVYYRIPSNSRLSGVKSQSNKFKYSGKFMFSNYFGNFSADSAEIVKENNKYYVKYCSRRVKCCLLSNNDSCSTHYMTKWFNDSSITERVGSSWIGESRIDSMVGSSSSVRDNISNLIKVSTTIEDKVSDSTNYDASYMEKRYPNSTIKSIVIKTKDIGANTLYYKLPTSISFSNGTLDGFVFSGSQVTNNSCVQMQPNISVDVLINEQSSFSLKPSEVSYPGSGFSLESTLSNTVNWYYRSILNNNEAGVKVSSPVELTLKKEISKDDVYYIKGSISTLNNVDLNDLYTDSSCSNKLVDKFDYSRLSSYISTKLNDEIKKPSNKIITSVNSNDAKSKDDVDVSTSVIGGGDITKSNKFLYNVKLNKGCIATKDMEIDGEKRTNGFVTYLDSVDAKCGDGYIEGVKPKDDQFVNMHFIPTDYSKNEVNLNVTDVDLSSVKGITINYTMRCPTTVNKKILKYRYRVINVKDPFPRANGNKSKIPSNWREWYDNTANKARLSNTYNKSPIYVLSVSKNRVSNMASLASINNYNELSAYTSWNNMNKDGTSSFISKIGFKTTNIYNGYCKLGEFSSGCDKYG